MQPSSTLLTVASLGNPALTLTLLVTPTPTLTLILTLTLTLTLALTLTQRTARAQARLTCSLSLARRCWLKVAVIGDSNKVEGRAVVTCEHEGGVKCAKPAPLRYRARGSRGAGGQQGKQVMNPPTTMDGKGKGKGKGEPGKETGGRGTPYNMWNGVQRASSNLKRRAAEQDAESNGEADWIAKAGASSDKSMSEGGGDS